MSYRPMPLARWSLLAMSAVFAAAGVWLVVTMARGDGPPVWFGVLWLGVAGWNAYWGLWRTCVELRVEGPTLAWATPLRRGSAPVRDVVRIRPSRASRQMAVIELRDRRPLLVQVRYGFADLQQAIAAGSPGVVVEGS